MTARKSWPFKVMQLGDTCKFLATEWGSLKMVSIAAHTYARQKGWKFETRTHEGGTSDAYMLVTRVPSATERAQERVDGRTLRRIRYPFEDLEVGGVSVAPIEEADRYISAVGKRNREGVGRWVTRKVWHQGAEPGGYVKITRVA